jgi:hypothetical protein
MELSHSSKSECSLGRSVIENVLKSFANPITYLELRATPQLKFFLRTGLRPLPYICIFPALTCNTILSGSSQFRRQQGTKLGLLKSTYSPSENLNSSPKAANVRPTFAEAGNASFERLRHSSSKFGPSKSTSTISRSGCD